MQPAALIVAAGKGERAGGAVPKQFRKLGGVPAIARAVDAFAGMPVHVVIGEGQEAALAEALEGRDVASTTIGGAERRDSVRAGLAAVAVSDATHVLIHDAARPFLPQGVIDRLLAALNVSEGVVPVLPVVDTLAKSTVRPELVEGPSCSPCDTSADGKLGRGFDKLSPDGLGGVVDRHGLVRVQTPQAFRLATIIAAHEAWTGGPATDDAQVARANGVDVVLVEGDPQLDKLTHPADFARAERQFGQWLPRTATGFDVHRLEAGESLWLGGVEIAHTHGLSGHSDADVALHALTDALLATIAAGDIGSHFPPSDPQWRGANSGQFVEHACKLIAARGGRIEHVDLTLICEAPKIGPHRDAMRAAIATLLGLEIARVSVKATTTERLGFTGRGEGLACQAAATVSLWTPHD